MDKELSYKATNDDSKHTVKEMILKYFSFYPLFVASLVLCVGVAYTYIKYTEPKYRATALILVKNSNSRLNGSTDLVDNALRGGNMYLQNDMMRLRSISLIRRVVLKNEFNVFFYETGNLIKSDIYHNAPFKLVSQHISDSTRTFTFNVTDITSMGATIAFGPQDTQERLTCKWNIPFSIEGNRVLLMPNSKLLLLTSGYKLIKEESYQIIWKPLQEVSADISNKLSVGMLGRDNTIMELNLLTENLERGKDVLNALCREFIQLNIEEKNEVAQSTIRFIDERLAVVTGQLGGVEKMLQNFKGKSKIIDPAQQASLFINNSNEVLKDINSINFQSQVVGMIRQYLENPAYDGKLVPSTLGLDDATFSFLISKYNDLQLLKERETPLNANSSLVLKDLSTQITNVKSSILESLQNISKNLSLKENSLRVQSSEYNQFLTSLPGKERDLQEIKRQQGITEGLYLYLLQKREETALSSSSTFSNYQQIDPASGYGPVEPNPSSIFKIAIMVGLFIPLVWIYARELLNDKVISKNDITANTDLPIMGEIGHISKIKNFRLNIKQGEKIEDQFQIIRTNLSLKQKNSNKEIILVTSSMSGEGKSLVSLNLATVFAKSGKKVALLEFDLRKPINQNHNPLPNNTGLTSYLAGQKLDLSKLYYTLEDTSLLHIYPTGAVKSNPANYLINSSLPDIIGILRQQYDCIIINSSPVGLVSDALVLGHYCNTVIYVVRQRYTLKRQISHINEIVQTGMLTNISLIVNDVKNGAKYGYYSYGGYSRKAKGNFEKEIN